MNEDEFKGGVRYVGGKAEKSIGDAIGSRDWQVDGIVDQVAGGAQNMYGRARSIVDEAVDAAPQVADEAKERLKAVGERAADAAQTGSKVAADAVRDTPVLWALAAAMGGYAIAWLVHGRRD